MLDHADVTLRGERVGPCKRLEQSVSPLWLPPRSGRWDCRARAISRRPGPWLEPISFDYAPAGGGLAVVRLLAEVDAALGPPSPAWLVARRSDLRSRHAPCASEALIDQVLLWEVSFRLPLELFEYPRALFDIEASGRVAIALPAPGLRMGAAELLAGEPKPRIRPLLRRSVVGLATGLALAAGSDSFVGLASAASAPTHTAKHRAAAYAHPAGTSSQASASSRSASTTLTASTTTVITTTVTRAQSGVLAKSTTTQTTTSDSKPLTGCVLMTTIVGNIKASETGRHAPRHQTETACGVPHKKKKKSRKHAPRKSKTFVRPTTACAIDPPPARGRRSTPRRAILAFVALLVDGPGWSAGRWFGAGSTVRRDRARHRGFALRDVMNVAPAGAPCDATAS